VRRARAGHGVGHRALLGGLLGVLLATAGTAQAPLAVETFDAAWTIVRDSHFDETLNGVDWEGVAAELRPRAARTGSPGELREVLREMLGRLGQSHFAVIPTSADDAGGRGERGGSPGFDVRLIGRDLVTTRVEADGGAATAGVRPGWIVRAIEEEPVAGLLAPLIDTLQPQLLQVEAWRLVQTRLRGPSGSMVRITFEDGAKQARPVTVPRRSERGSPVTVGTLPTMFVRVDSHRKATPQGRSVGVIGFNVWMATVDDQFQQAIDEHRAADGVIVDLRGNPGGLAAMLMGISGHFIDERRVLGVMKTRDHELKFVVNPRRVNARGERVTPFAGPVAILIDGLSGSASECFTGGMQALGRARVVGERSMGQALPALFSRLPNGDVLIHAYGDFVTADGTRLEGRGVIPDEEVVLTRAHLLEGRDPVMEAALAWMDAADARPPALLLQ
jgi:carboxyl-terminal processing protease